MSLANKDHERVSEIFLRAVDLPLEEREAYLCEACRGDRGLRAEVESLLSDDGKTPDVLKSGALDRRIQSELERAPTRVGGCHIVAKIGEGGMGVVYRAEQEHPVRRRVAIKLIRRGFETDRVIARFESERQALALMSHPGITQVYDAGVTEDGRPYIVMEYVDGLPITDYCDRHLLGIPERLRLFIDVCEAVQHAHHKTVIHRDIKSSNILVTQRSGRPLPKIIDFGVAKATEQRRSEQNLTESGQFVGTPEYTSPEQAEVNEGRVDTRTDVYSLGVVLYELLAGAQPFDPDELRRGTLDEIRRRIREDDPPKPSSRLADLPDREKVAVARRCNARALVRRLSNDLDWITMRAMEKDPDRRYSSPKELAEDLRRQLREEPVLAGPPSWVYRTKKLVRKHRIGVTFAATLALLLVGAAAVLLVQLQRVALEKNRADVAAQQATQKAEAARQVSDFLVGIFDLAPDREAARRQIDAAVRKVEHDVRVRPEQRARLLYPLGRIYDNLGFAEGTPLMLQALDELRNTLSPDDPEVLAAMHARGLQLAREQRLEEAETLLADVLRARRRVLGADHPDTTHAMAHLGRVKEMQGRFADAESLIFESIERSRRALGEDNPITLLALGYAANLRLRQARFEESERRFREVILRLTRTMGPEHPNTLACLIKLGCVLAQQGDIEQALSLVRRAIDGGWAQSWSDGPKTPTHVGLQNEPLLAPLRGHPEFEALVGPQSWLAALERTRQAARAREFDDALDSLKLAEQRGLPSAEALLRDDDLAPLFTHPQFQAIVARLQENSD